MHWKVKIFTLLYQHAAIPTSLGLRQIRFPSEIPGLKICSVFTVASLPAALCPFCALAFERWLCAESSVSHFFSVSQRIAGLVSGAPGAVSAISWLAVPAAELPKTQPPCSQNQPAGRALRARVPGSALGCWGAGKAAPSTKHDSNNTVHHLAPVQSLRQRQLFSVPLKSYAFPSGNAWCILSLPISGDSSKNPTPVQKAGLLRAGEWEMPGNPFLPLGMANACIHLGSREKPSFSPWFCCQFQSLIYFILHGCPEFRVRPSPWNKEPEAELSPGRIAQSFQIYTIYPTKNVPFILKIFTHACNAQNTCSSHLREALQSQFPLSGLPLKGSQVNHKGRGAAFSVPPLFSGNSRSYTWKEEWCRDHGLITPPFWAISWGDISIV